jgi:hypothetical protein
VDAPPASPLEPLAAALRAFGLLCRLGVGLGLVALFATVKLAPAAPTAPFFGALPLLAGLAAGPGWGLPTLLTGRMRVRAGLLGVMSQAATGRPPEAAGAELRALGALVLLGGTGAAALGLLVMGEALRAALG